MNKKDAIRKITECAKAYKENLANKNILFLFGNPGKPQYIEALFLPRHFKHLTGVVLPNEHSSTADFYKKAAKQKLQQNDFELALNGTTELKLEVLPRLMEIHKVAKMAGDFSSVKAILSTEKVTGTVNACIGFVKEGDYYVPNTALKEDIREVSVNRQGIFAILRKPNDQKNYTEVCFIRKGLALDQIAFPEEVIITLEEKEDGIESI